MGDDALTVNNLNTWFYTREGIVKAVRNVSFVLKKGEILGIVGESGSGKSVTGMSIMGLVDDPGRIVSGKIRLGEIELTDLDFEEMRHIRGNKISMVFQNPLMVLNPVHRVGDQMIEAVSEHLNIPRSKIQSQCIEKLAAVGIPAPEERFTDYPHELSGGMRQRIVIATALLLNPDVIIADEPTTALDVTIQAQIIHQTRKLIDNFERGMIWITHDLSTLSELADHIVVMYAGSVLEQGTTREIISTPRNPYTHQLLASIPSNNSPGKKLFQIPGNMPSMIDLGDGCPFANRCDRKIDLCRQPIEKQQISPSHFIWCCNPILKKN